MDVFAFPSRVSVKRLRGVGGAGAGLAQGKKRKCGSLWCGEGRKTVGIEADDAYGERSVLLNEVWTLLKISGGKVVGRFVDMLDLARLELGAL